MLQEHVLAEEEQMTAARTKQHEEDKHTGIRTDEKKKRSKQGKKGRKIGTQGVDSNKSFRLCCKAWPGTLRHDLLSSSYSRRHRYQVSVLPLPRDTVSLIYMWATPANIRSHFGSCAMTLPLRYRSSSGKSGVEECSVAWSDGVMERRAVQNQPHFHSK